MTSFAQKIFRLTSMEWSKLLQYRADITLWTLAVTISPLVSMALWYAVAMSSGDAKNAHITLVYYIFVSFLGTATLAWSGYYIAQEILTGEIAKHLLKPFSLFWGHIVTNVVEKLLRLMIPLPVLIIARVLFYPFFTGAIISASLLPIALLSIFLAMCIAFLLDISLGLIAFWLEDAMQIRRFQDLLYQVASGVLIPYSFLPPTVHDVFSFLPYRYIISAPAELLTGQLGEQEAFKIILIQLTWILLLFIVVSVEWRQGLKKYAPPG